MILINQNYKGINTTRTEFNSQLSEKIKIHPKDSALKEKISELEEIANERYLVLQKLHPSRELSESRITLLTTYQDRIMNYFSNKLKKTFKILKRSARYLKKQRDILYEKSSTTQIKNEKTEEEKISIFEKLKEENLRGLERQIIEDKNILERVYGPEKGIEILYNQYEKSLKKVYGKECYKEIWERLTNQKIPENNNNP